jgi:hypothetical protein
MPRHNAIRQPFLVVLTYFAAYPRLFDPAAGMTPTALAGRSDQPTVRQPLVGPSSLLMVRAGLLKRPPPSLPAVGRFDPVRAAARRRQRRLQPTCGSGTDCRPNAPSRVRRCLRCGPPRKWVDRYLAGRGRLQDSGGRAVASVCCGEGPALPSPQHCPTPGGQKRSSSQVHSSSVILVCSSFSSVASWYSVRPLFSEGSMAV